MPIPEFKRGERPGASHLNKMVRVDNALETVIGDGLIEVRRTSRGIALGLNVDLVRERIPKVQLRYEEFAAAGDNYATVDEDNPDVNDQGVFSLYHELGAGKDRCVLVHSDQIYGQYRTVQQLVFDIAYTSSTYYAELSVDQFGPGQNPVGFNGDLLCHCRAITSDFDPATITWTLAQALSYNGTVASTYLLRHNTVDSMLIAQEGHAEGTATAIVELDVKLPGMLAFKGDEAPPGAWNALDAIYGWELSLEVVAGSAVKAEWIGAPDHDQSRSYVIRPE